MSTPSTVSAPELLLRPGMMWWTTGVTRDEDLTLEIHRRLMRMMYREHSRLIAVDHSGQAAEGNHTRWWLQYRGVQAKTVWVLIDVRVPRDPDSNGGRLLQFSLAATLATSTWNSKEVSPLVALELFELPLIDIERGMIISGMSRAATDSNDNDLATARTIGHPETFPLPLIIADKAARKTFMRSSEWTRNLPNTAGVVQLLLADKHALRLINRVLPSSCRLAPGTVRALAPSPQTAGLLVASPRVPVADGHGVADLCEWAHQHYLSNLRDIADLYGQGELLRDMARTLLAPPESAPSHSDNRRRRTKILNSLDTSAAGASEEAQQTITELNDELDRLRHELTAARKTNTELSHDRDTLRSATIAARRKVGNLHRRHSALLQAILRYRAVHHGHQQQLPDKHVPDDCARRHAELVHELDTMSAELDDALRRAAWLSQQQQQANSACAPLADSLPPADPVFSSFADLLSAGREHLSPWVWLAPTLEDTTSLLEPARSSWLRKTWDTLVSLHEYASAKASRLTQGDPAGADLATFYSYLAHADRVPGRRISRTIVAMSESDSVLAKPAWRAERIFPVPVTVDQSGKAMMVAHVKLARHQIHWPSLYFREDLTASGLVVSVGYIGPHLTNTHT